MAYDADSVEGEWHDYEILEGAPGEPIDRPDIDEEDDDTLLWTSPMFHVNGWGHIYGLTGIGGKHVVLRDFDPGTVFERIAAYDVSYLGGAPTVLDRYWNKPEQTERAFEERRES